MRLICVFDYKICPLQIYAKNELLPNYLVKYYCKGQKLTDINIKMLISAYRRIKITTFIIIIRRKWQETAGQCPVSAAGKCAASMAAENCANAQKILGSRCGLMSNG